MLRAAAVDDAVLHQVEVRRQRQSSMARIRRWRGSRRSWRERVARLVGVALPSVWFAGCHRRGVLGSSASRATAADSDDKEQKEDGETTTCDGDDQ